VRNQWIGDAALEMTITFSGGARVDASFGPHTVRTDQPPSGGGQASAPTPLAVFLSSIGTCAGIYVLGFLHQRGLSADGVRLVQRMHAHPLTGMIEQIELDIEVPADFPEKYRSSLARAAELCAVKKHFEQPPRFNITTVSRAPVAA
jgi:putative redox protein